MPPWARKRNVSTVNGALLKICETRSHRSAAIRAGVADRSLELSNTEASTLVKYIAVREANHDKRKDLPRAEARRRSDAPEGGPILALDGSNDCLESTADSANKNVKQGRDELEHDVLLTSGRCRTRGLIGAPLTLAIHFARPYLNKTTYPLSGGTETLSPAT